MDGRGEGAAGEGGSPMRDRIADMEDKLSPILMRKAQTTFRSKNKEYIVVKQFSLEEALTFRKNLKDHNLHKYNTPKSNTYIP